jgi:Initiation factor 2 subunit family
MSGSTETRPRNQGAGLTAWELGEHGVPHTVIVDNAGGHLMREGLVAFCIVGTDRTTAGGDNYRVEVIHVNHAFEMLLGIRIRELVFRRTGRTARLICDTHDVQAKTYVKRGTENPFSKRQDIRRDHDDYARAPSR